MSREYHRWPLSRNITLFLDLQGEDGAGVVGATPEVAIRRYRQLDGTPLDGHFWNGSAFQAGAFWHSMSEVDAVNTPGQYSYDFEQALIGVETVYLAYYRHTDSPVGFDSEQIVVSDESFTTKVTAAVDRVLGLLHQNAILDNQVYTATGQLASARLRVFDSAGNVPTVAGGSEVTGLVQEYEIQAAYAAGRPTELERYVLKVIL